tara:strand:- start:693 stop:893 length:201 start_codon:yes stop_codon:yes gene_type:complete
MTTPFKLKYKNSAFPFRTKADPAILTDKEKAKLTQKFQDRDFVKEKFNTTKMKRKNIPHDWNERFV